MFGENAGGLTIVIVSARSDDAAGFVYEGRADGLPRLVGLNTRISQGFARKVETAYGGVFVEIAQNVRQLQRAAEVEGEREAGIFIHAEDLDGEAANGAGHMIAIKIKGGEIGGADVLGDVHIHAVDHGKEILLAQMVTRDCVLQEYGGAGRATLIEAGDIGAPCLERFVAVCACTLSIVGDVVHRAAEGIDREHRIALGLRQYPHRGIKRAAGSLFLHRAGHGFNIHHVGGGSHGFWASRDAAFLGRNRRPRKPMVASSAKPSASGLR